MITTFIRCKKINIDNNIIDYCDYLAKVKKYNTKNDHISYFFDSYNIYFNTFIDSNWKEVLREIIIIIIGIFTFFFKKFFSLYVIYYKNPLYVIFAIPLKFLLQKEVSVFYSIPNNDQITKDKYKIYKLLLDTSGDIFSLIGFLIFLGIIELHFCNFGVNVPINIMERGDKDQKKCEMSESSFTNSEQDENNNILEQNNIFLENNNKLLEDTRITEPSMY